MKNHVVDAYWMVNVFVDCNVPADGVNEWLMCSSWKYSIVTFAHIMV